MVINSMYISKAIKSMLITNQVAIPRICIYERKKLKIKEILRTFENMVQF